MKVYLFISVIIFAYVSFVFPINETGINFLRDNAGNQLSDSEELNELVIKSSFNKLNQFQDFSENHSSNNFVHMMSYQTEAKFNNIECDNLNSFFTQFDQETFKKLSDCLNTQLVFPIKLELLNYILLKIRKSAHSNRLISNFKLAYNEADILQYLEVSINKHSTKLSIKSLNLKISQLKGDMLFVYKSNEDENYYFAQSLESLPEQQQIEELDDFMNYLEILTQNKSKQEIKIRFENFTPKVKTSSDQGGLHYLSQAFEKVKKTWSTILSIFHTSRVTRITKLLVDTGYSHYDQSVQVQILSGMRREGLKYLYDVISMRLDVPSEKRQYISSVLETIEWSDTNTWADFDFVFSINDGAKVKYASVFSNRGDNDTFNFVITEVEAAFELAPEIMLVTKKLSVLGGLWNQRTTEVEYNPRNISHEDLDNVFNFFQVIIYKQVASQFGINLELPR